MSSDQWHPPITQCPDETGDWSESTEWHPPNGSQHHIDEKIRDVGYSPYPHTDAVDTDLYRTELTDWLNERAGFAFVIDQTAQDDTVDVEFELPFGGTFTRTFHRPDAAIDGRLPLYTDLLATADVPVDSLSTLPSRRVPIERDGDEWTIQLTQDTRSEIVTRSVSPRHRYLGHLVANRLLIPIMTLGMAGTAYYPSETRGLVISLVLTTLTVGYYVIMMGFWNARDKGVYYPHSMEWINHE